MKEKLNIGLRSVTLKQLRVLTAAVRQGTFSAAATALNVTPPAITLQMRLLEEAAGIPLVERGESGLQPTDGGRELLSTAARIETALAECAENLERLNGIDGGRVKVGIVGTAKYFAPRALAAFAKTHPNVDVRLSVANRTATIVALRNFEFDFAVMGRPPEDFEVEHEVIGDHPHIIIAPPDHPFSSRKNLSLSGLADERFLLREVGSGTRMLMMKLFKDADVNPNTGMEMGSNETIKQAVIAGLGIALISAHTVAAELKEKRLVAFDVQGLPVVRQWFVVKRPEKRLLPAARALWDFLTEKGESLLP